MLEHEDVIVFPTDHQCDRVANEVLRLLEQALKPALPLLPDRRPWLYNPPGDGWRVICSPGWIECRPGADPEALVADFLETHGPQIEREYRKAILRLPQKLF